MKKEQSPAKIEMDLTAEIPLPEGPVPEVMNMGFVEEPQQNQTQIIPHIEPVENESARISMFEAPPLPPADMAPEDISEIEALNQSGLQGNMASVGNQNVSQIAPANQSNIQGNMSVLENASIIEGQGEDGAHEMDDEAIQGGQRRRMRSYRKKRNQKQRKSRKFRNASYRRRSHRRKN